MVPTLFGSSVAQVNLLLDTLIASFLITGSQTWLDADRSPARISARHVRRRARHGDPAVAVAPSRQHRSRGILARRSTGACAPTLLIAVPAMLGAGAAGQADARDAVPARPLHRARRRHGGAVAVGADASACRRSRWSRCVAPAFYARQDTKTPVRAGVVAMIANMVLNVLFVARAVRAVASARRPRRRLARGDREGAGPAHGARAGECAGELPQPRAALARAAPRRHLRAPAGLGEAPRAARRCLRRRWSSVLAAGPVAVAGLERTGRAMTRVLAPGRADRRGGAGLPTSRVLFALRLPTCATCAAHLRRASALRDAAAILAR